MEHWISKNYLYVGRVISVAVGDVALDDGRPALREVVEHNGGVGVLPVVGDSVVLVRQYRIAIERHILEIPAGRLERGESPEDTARRELIEEVGLEGGRLEHVVSCYCSPGFTNEMDHIFLAFGLTTCEAQPEDDERIEPVMIPVSELTERMARGDFDDAKTIIAIQSLLAMRRDQ